MYAKFLSIDPSETHLLFKELIMDVTIFFRNPDAFESLKAILKKKFPHPWTRERFEGLGDRPPHRRRGLFDRDHPEGADGTGRKRSACPDL